MKLKFLAGTIVALFCIIALTQVGLAAEPDYLTEYPLTGKPFNIAVEAPNKVWFTMPDSNAIGFLDTTDPNNPQFTQYDLPNTNSEPYDIVFYNGFVWFTEKSGNRIGRLDVSNGQIDEYPVPTANSGPTGIDVAPNGLVWFLEQDADKLVAFDPSAETFDEHLYIRVNAGLEDIVVVNNDQIQFTVPLFDEIAKYSPSSDQFAPEPTSPPIPPPVFGEPMGITADSLGKVWVTSYADSYIGRFAGGTTARFRWTQTPGPASGAAPDSGPAQIAFFNAGQQWRLFYSEYNTGRVSLLSTLTNSGPSGAVTYPLSSPTAKPWGVDVDADGSAWFALTGSNAVAEWCAPYAIRYQLPIIRAGSLGQ